MDKFKMLAKYEEDFIWSIRQRRRIEEEENEDKLKPPPKPFKLKFEKDTRAQIMGSMVPDEVILSVNDYEPREYTGCLLYGDFFGFIELLDQCNREGLDGPSRITKVLNDYIGGIMAEVMSFQGDILRFSSDYFLVLWKCTGKLLNYCIHAAINCALVIQKKFGQFKTEEGLKLKVKLCITAGPLIFSLIGNTEMSHFVCVGPPVDDIKETEQRSDAGDILVAPSAWMHVDTSEYRAVEIEDGAHFKVKYATGIILASSCPQATTIQNSEFIAGSTELFVCESNLLQVLGIGMNWKYRGEEYAKILSSKQEFSEDLEIRDSDESFTKYYLINNRMMEDITLRPIIVKAADKENDLRRFILTPIIQTMNSEKPIETLMEIRQIVIMFVNIVAKKTTPISTVGIIDRCHKIICEKLKIYKGVVSKISLFDKDMVFLIIFGLRGTENNFECREALKCSYRCQQDLQHIKEVQSVSIACTTGKSYCGIFGHNLRRDYGFISMNFQKAAKMVVAYPDKVICDRQTFVYSKMTANHFTVMEYKKLRGIPQHGLIYAYSEREAVRTLAVTLKDCAKYPILGRDNEMDHYVKNVGNFLKKIRQNDRKNVINCVLIEGHPLQGKSRLLNEFVYVTNDIRVNKITFEKTEFAAAYKGMKLIWAPILKMNTLEETRREILMEILKNVKKPQFLCVLNDIFNVDFPKPPEFFEMEIAEKFERIKYYIARLCVAYFKKPWLICLDNAGFMDVESWNLLPTMLNTKTFFLIVAIDKDRRQIGDYLRFSRSRDVYRISLRNLPKIYHAGLACQILGTYAIPADLEYALQSQGNGNPGWIENCLITLLQSKKIYIQNAYLESVYRKGLVVPPLYMQKRMHPEEIQRYKLLFEEKIAKNSNFDRWENYVDACRDKTEDVEIRGQFFKLVFKEDELPVCVLSKSFNANHDVDPEISTKMEIFKLYDSLPHQEQRLLMCASILNDPFTRRILLYIWGGFDDKLAGEIIQSLFEKRILCCAKGDFSGGGEYILLRESMKDQNKEKLIECFCVGLDVHDSCLFMPKYASCGFLRFKSDKFREAVYNLIPNGQKKELHTRAAKFIQKETRRCIACGCAYFTQYPCCKLANTPAGRVEIERETKKKHVNLEHMGFEELFDYSTNRGKKSTVLGSILANTSTRRSWSLTSMSRRSTFFLISNEDGYTPETYETRHSRSLNLITPFMIFKMQESPSLIRTFSQLDFNSCECHLILLHMYSRLMRHYKGSGQWWDMMITSMHYVKICISQKNYRSAWLTIEDALDVLNKNLLGDLKWKIRMLYAKVYSFQGIILLHMNQMEEAFKKLSDAMELFGYKFPKNGGKLTFHLKLWGQKMRQRMGLYFFPETLLRDEHDTSQLHIANSISETLCYLSEIYVWKLAELAAVWSLRSSLETETSLIRICESFICMMTIAQHYRNKFLSLSLEFHALRYCHKKKNMMEAPELKAVAQLYTIIFEARYGRSEFEGALHIGYIALNVARASNESKMAIRLLTHLAVILLERMYMQEVISVLHELEYFSDHSDDTDGRIWYYALVTGFHLETGYMIIPFNVVQLFFNGEQIRLTNTFYEAKMRLIIIMWVWCLRTERWEAAGMYKNEVNQYRNFEIENNEQAITALYLLEGELLTLVYQINKRTIKGSEESKKRVETIVRKLRKSKSSWPLIFGKLSHLEAYYAYIVNDDEKTKKLLKKGLKFCIKHEFKLGVIHFEHSEKAWNNELSPFLRDFWKNHCTNDTYIPSAEMDFENLKIYSYTYPTPLFEN